MQTKPSPATPLHARVVGLAIAAAAVGLFWHTAAEAGDKHHKKKVIECPETISATPSTYEEFACIDEGFRVFTKETFEGNGRTCATCHIPGERYNIFPATIKKMSPKKKRLVFAPHVPGLENFRLVKKFALFNIAGDDHSDATDTAAFDIDDDPTNSDELGHHFPVFRSTMAIQGLDVTSVNAANRGTPLFPAVCSQGDGGSVPNVAGQLPQLGWAGDGAPGTPNGALLDECRTHHGNLDVDSDGSVRAFANGAIAQHNPKSLARIAKSSVCDPDVNNPKAACGEAYDFRFATDNELDAMAAFQNWLGRRALSDDERALNGGGAAEEFDLTLFSFADPRMAPAAAHFDGVAQCSGPGGPGGVPGNDLGDADGCPGDLVPNPAAAAGFGAGCSACHNDAGSMAAFAPGNNLNFNTEVELASDDIGYETIGVGLPHDEGGTVIFGPPGPPNAVGGFNTQSIIEAATKKAFFHNHKVVGDLEQSIEHYFSDDNLFPNGGLAVAATPESGMRFGDCDTVGALNCFPNGDGVEQMGAMLRSLTAYYLLRDCERLIDEAITRVGAKASLKLPVQHCQFNLTDVNRVLRGSKLKKPKLYSHVARGAQKLKKPFKQAAGWGSVYALTWVRDQVTELKNEIGVIAPPAPPVAAEAETEPTETEVASE